MPAPKRASTDTVVHREPFHDVSEALFMENFSAHGKKPEDSLLASCYDIRSNAVQQCMDLVNSVRRVYANPTLNSVQQDIEGRQAAEAPHDRAHQRLRCFAPARAGAKG